MSNKEKDIREKYRKEAAEVKREFYWAMGRHLMVFRQMEEQTIKDLNNKLTELKNDMDKELTKCKK